MNLRDQLQSSLGDGYTVGRELGGGGMSRVYVAADTTLDRRIIVKVLAPELSEGLSLDRFRREIQLAARLQHPNIVTVLSAGQAGDLPFYKDAVRGRGPPSVAIVRPLKPRPLAPHLQ